MKRRPGKAHQQEEGLNRPSATAPRRRRPRSDRAQRSENTPRGSEGSQISPTSDSIPPSQATDSCPNHEAHNAATVRGDRRGALGTRLGHADDGLDQTRGAELPPRGACDRDAVDADAAPRPPAKAVLNSPGAVAAGHPTAPLRRSFVESRVKIYICNPGFLVRSGRNSRRLCLRTEEEQ